MSDRTTDGAYLAARMARIALFRAEWARDDKPITLDRSHRLLSDDELASHLMVWAINFCYPAGIRNGVGAFAFPPRDDNDQFVFPYEDGVRPLCRTAVSSKIENGDLGAFGIEAGKELRGKPVRIPADRWHLYEIDFDKSTASLNGTLALMMITVERSKSATVKKKTPSDRSIKTWCDQYRVQHPDAPTQKTFCKEAAKALDISRDRGIIEHHRLWPGAKQGRGSKKTGKIAG